MVRRHLALTVATSIGALLLAVACGGDGSDPSGASRPARAPVADLAGEVVGSDQTIDIAAWRGGIAVVDGQGAGGDGRPRLLLATTDAPQVRHVELPGEPLVFAQLVPRDDHLYVAGVVCPEWTEEVEEDADPFDACGDRPAVVTHRYDADGGTWTTVTAEADGDERAFHLLHERDGLALGHLGDGGGLAWLDLASGQTHAAAEPPEDDHQETCAAGGAVIAAASGGPVVQVLRAGAEAWEDVVVGGPSPNGGRPIGCSTEGVLWLTGSVTDAAQLWELTLVEGAVSWRRPPTHGLPADLSDVDVGQGWDGPTVLWSGPNPPDPGGHDVFVRDGDGKAWRSLGRLPMVDQPRHYATDGRRLVYAGPGDATQELHLLGQG